MNMLPLKITEFLEELEIDVANVESLNITWDRYEGNLEVAYRSLDKRNEIYIQATKVVIS